MSYGDRRPQNRWQTLCLDEFFGNLLMLLCGSSSSGTGSSAKMRLCASSAKHTHNAQIHWKSVGKIELTMKTSSAHATYEVNNETKSSVSQLTACYEYYVEYKHTTSSVRIMLHERALNKHKSFRWSRDKALFTNCFVAKRELCSNDARNCFYDEKFVWEIYQSTTTTTMTDRQGVCVPNRVYWRWRRRI